jgi:hypothetical protein
MNRTFQPEDDCVRFIKLESYMNHSREHLYQRPKGTFYTRSKILQWGIGALWKYFGIGGRR